MTNKLPYSVVASDFHGGHTVSRHKTAEAAIGKYLRLSKATDCTCGCYKVVGDTKTQEQEIALAIDPNTGNPYFA